MYIPTGAKLAGRVTEVSEHTGEIDGLPVFWRSGAYSDAPALYLHGVPTNSDDWLGFLARTGGLAPDLPGFGRTGKPGHYDYSIGGYERFLEQFLTLVGVLRVKLIVHDWGSVGLAWAQRHPERVERLVLINAVPLLPGIQWSRLARIWRTPLLGELAMGSTTRRVIRHVTRDSNVASGPLPDSMLDSIFDHFDQGTQRATLRLYRSASEETLLRAGARQSDLDMPALVVWGERDPYLPVQFAQQYASLLPRAELVTLPDAGHWPWLDRPELIERVAEFLGQG
jgi:pimeloyl-ACP methyl ester carboxylesterase